MQLILISNDPLWQFIVYKNRRFGIFLLNTSTLNVDFCETWQKIDFESFPQTLLLERISMLNSEQRFIFDDIINRLITGHFEDEQFLIYIRYFCILLYKFYKTIFQWRCWYREEFSLQYIDACSQTYFKARRGFS